MDNVHPTAKVETNFVLDRPFKLRIDEPLDGDTINSDSIKIINAASGDQVTAQVTQLDAHTIQVTPEFLDTGRYEIVIKEIRTTAGRSILGDVSFGALVRQA